MTDDARGVCCVAVRRSTCAVNAHAPGAGGGGGALRVADRCARTCETPEEPRRFTRRLLVYHAGRARGARGVAGLAAPFARGPGCIRLGPFEMI